MTELQHFNPPELPDLPFPLSAATRWGDLVFISGQVPHSLESFPDVVSDDFREQAVQTFKNVVAALRAAGSSPEKILKVTVYLQDLDDFDVMNEVMEQFIPAPYPARMTCQVVLRGFQIEVECIAVADDA